MFREYSDVVLEDILYISKLSTNIISFNVL